LSLLAQLLVPSREVGPWSQSQPGVWMLEGTAHAHGTTANMTLGQRAIFSLGAELRGRLNGLYVAAFFIGCAVGSAGP
jgi:hypothetical protein